MVRGKVRQHDARGHRRQTDQSQGNWPGVHHSDAGVEPPRPVWAGAISRLTGDCLWKSSAMWRVWLESEPSVPFCGVVLSGVYLVHWSALFIVCSAFEFTPFMY